MGTIVKWQFLCTSTHWASFLMSSVSWSFRAPSRMYPKKSLALVKHSFHLSWSGTGLQLSKNSPTAANKPSYMAIL